MQRRHRILSELKVQESARAITCTNAELAAKLLAMGILPGTRIEMVRPAPFGDAFYIKADGVRMALRAEEAACILMEV